MTVTSTDAVRHAFTSLFQYAVIEKSANRRFVILEFGAGWIRYWLDRMDPVDASHQGVALRPLLPGKPSVYFRRQRWISADPDKKALAGVIPAVGADRFSRASDFPHPDHPSEYITELERPAAALPEGMRADFVGGNVLRASGEKESGGKG